MMELRAECAWRGKRNLNSTLPTALYMEFDFGDLYATRWLTFGGFEGASPAPRKDGMLRGGNPPFFSDPTSGGPFSDVVGDLLFAQSNNEATNKAGSNGSRSSTCSPTPT